VVQNQARLHASVDGRVQGVGFRAFVADQAHNMGLTGWVRNRWDGKVEVLAEGERQILERFLALLRRGPRSAYVSELKFDWMEATGDLEGFIVRRTE
jgi:acylphosphatase